MTKSKGCYTYIIEYEQPTRVGTHFYVGVTAKPLSRWRDHVREHGARAIKRLGFKRVVCTRLYETRGEAMREEKRAQKRIRSGWIPSEDNCSYIEPEALKNLILKN